MEYASAFNMEAWASVFSLTLSDAHGSWATSIHMISFLSMRQIAALLLKFLSTYLSDAFRAVAFAGFFFPACCPAMSLSLLLYQLIGL